MPLFSCQSCGRCDLTASNEPDPHFIKDLSTNQVLCQFCFTRKTNYQLLECPACHCVNGPLLNTHGSGALCLTCFSKTLCYFECDTCHSKSQPCYFNRDGKNYCSSCLKFNVVESDCV